jgi:folylpolyglutamate synthase/dihydropteroate synthase
MQTHPTLLTGWLAHLETMHPKAIDMGLDRVRAVKDAMQVEFACPVIIVGGTNGKGSTCAMLEAILLQAGYRVGLYTSPHLLHFNERMRINGESVSDDALITCFNKLDVVRDEVSLSYFEFTTLAAIQLFADAKLDAVIFEVGLGGRLDAVNVLDADVSIVTSVDIDHTEYLGDTREKIGFEKAGIYRAGKTAICGDPVPPQSLVQHAEKIGADLWLFNRERSTSQFTRLPSAARRESITECIGRVGGIGSAAHASAGRRAGDTYWFGIGRIAGSFSSAAGSSDRHSRRCAQPACSSDIGTESRQHGIPSVHLRCIRRDAGQGH